MPHSKVCEMLNSESTNILEEEEEELGVVLVLCGFLKPGTALSFERGLGAHVLVRNK